MHPLERHDAFDFVSNDDLRQVYYQAIKDNDEDLEYLTKEMVRRGLLGTC